MLTRRTLLKSAMLVSTVAAVGRSTPSTAAASQSPIALRLFDSRSPTSLAWLGPRRGNAIDTVGENATRWRRLRDSDLVGRVAGLTGWSDFVQARGLLEQKGRRLRVESRSGNLFYWEMA